MTTALPPPVNAWPTDPWKRPTPPSPTETANVRLLAANIRFAAVIAELRRGVRAALGHLRRGDAQAGIDALQAVLEVRDVVAAAAPDRVLQRDGG